MNCAGGGDTSRVESRLATCRVKAVFPSARHYIALCSDGSIVGWGGERTSTEVLFDSGETQQYTAKQMMQSFLNMSWVLGLKWKEVAFNSQYSGYMMLENEKLASALQIKADFTTEELQDLDVKNLRAECLIKSGLGHPNVDFWP